MNEYYFNKIKVFCPATVANVSCGFDVLGLALETVGDEMTVSLIKEPGVRISKISGQNLPTDPYKNVAGVAVMALMKQLMNAELGVEISIVKKIKPGSGIGSSAASASGAVWALNELLKRPFTNAELVAFAMEGEKLASGVPHADNVAPAIFGGFTLVRSYEPLDIIPLPVPIDLYAVVLHPQIEVKTADSRKILKQTLSMQQAIKQWGNLGGLVAGLFREDYELISRSLEDHVVEPVRSILIPFFKEVTTLAKDYGALGTGISGSGPSVFALCKGVSSAEKVREEISNYYSQTGIPFEIHLSKIAKSGVRPLS